MSDVSLNTVPSSLVFATDYDVLPLDHVVQRRDGYLTVSSPGNLMSPTRARCGSIRVPTGRW